MKGKHLTFPCGHLTLEGVCHRPQGSGPFPAVVLCHPHPLFGGSMGNNVVLSVCEALAREGILAFRFNFRGVEESDGAFAEGIGEQEDVKAALAFVTFLEEVDRTRVGLVGYSFGALVALPVALEDEQVRALALISLLLPSADSERLMDYPKPKLLLCGSEDFLISVPELQRLIEKIPEPKQYEVVSGADHFWWGYEDRIAGRIAAFFSGVLGLT